jgi:hypothetical protein
MANLSSIAGEDLYNETSYPTTKVGSRGMDSYGAVYRYVYVGGVALVTGNLLQETAEDTQFNNMAVPAIEAIGQTVLTVTNGTTAVTANLFDGGQLFVSYSTGIGQNFRILSHMTGASGASIDYTVDRPLKIALATTSKITVRKNKFNGVIQTPTTTVTGGPVGVALYANTLNYYGWIQSGGDTACLADDGTNFASSDSGVARSLSVAGCVKPADGSEGGEIIGVTNNVSSTDAYMLSVNLFLN